MDSAAHRHPRAPHRRPGRRDLRPGEGSGARRDRARPGITPADIGFIVVGTTTPDTIFPEHRVRAAAQDRRDHALGLRSRRRLFRLHLCADRRHADGRDRRARACAGGRRRRDVEHHRLHAIARPASCSATAPARWCCRAAGDDEPAIIDFAHEIDGSGGPALCMPAGGSRMPASHETVDKRLHYVKQDGQAVFKFAVRKTEEISRRVLERNGLAAVGARSVRLAPGEPPHHQGGGRAARPARVEGRHQPRAVRQHDRRRPSRWRSPMRWPTGRLKRGDLVLLASVGAGFTVGAVLLRWGF